MHPRYMVTSTRMVAGAVETSTFAFGRFENLEAAEAEAHAKYGQYGQSVSAVRMESRSEAFLYLVFRVLTRTLRILFGVIVALAAYLFLWDPDPAISRVPFGEMTLDMVFRALIRGGLLFCAAWVAWYSAFGEGPDARYRP